jgi:hypothetical protein
MTLRNHAIVGAAKGGLKSNYFSTRSYPRASTCPFSKTVVWIAALPQLFKDRAPSIPAMRQDRRSHDLDGAFEMTVQICSFKFYGSDETFLNQRM